MAKLPECERPNSSLMKKKLYSKISSPFRQIFIEDVHYDCGCEIETYDAEIGDHIWYLSAPDKVEFNYRSRISLPVILDISDQSISLLLEKVCKEVHGITTGDVVPYVALLNNKATTEQQDLVRSRIYRQSEGIVLTDFVPENTYFLFPEPEFFGAITMNIRGYGAFGITTNVSRFKF